MAPNGEQVQVESRADWRRWLAANHDRPTGIWLVTFKKHCGDRYVAYNDVVEEALCFGWIDSLPRRLDDDRTMLWLAPRQPGSGWSKLNKDRVERLIAAGQMAASGLAAIAAAQADGSWQALDGVEALEIPPDLATALAAYGAAAANFDAFPRSAKRGILEWIANAKRPATRTRRIEETARLAQDNIRANQWPRSG
ncbi:MAG: YdeI/OmpD-associated family protein [Leptolyngbya sp.]|nr:YdeI/OmpD-associated family protein [Leptolyngbya sp.]